jgi:hypothetical protein
MLDKGLKKGYNMSMKSKILGFVILLMAGTASAHWHGYGGCCYRPYYGGGWVAPAIIGGVIGYELSRPQPQVIVQQPPVIVQQPPIVTDSNVVIINGIVYRKQQMIVDGVLQDVLIKQ